MSDANTPLSPPPGSTAVKRKRKCYTIHDRKADYERWWLGKVVRQPYDGCKPIGRVVSIEVFGPPSGVTCVAELRFDNGEKRNLCGGPFGFRPCKWELVVVPDEKAQTKSL